MIAGAELSTLALATPAPEPAAPSLVTTERACYLGAESKGTLCRWVYDRFNNETLAESSDWLIAKPAKILAILLVAWIIRRLLHRAIGRMVLRLADGVPSAAFGRSRTAPPTGPSARNATLAVERRQQRAATVSSVLRSVSTGVIYTVSILMALAELGLNIGPLIASAGIIGVALGFGAQSLVKDFLSGIFMVIEDQYGVGDVTDLGDAVGTVEAVGLRVTRLRDTNGTVWYVRNGEVLRVGNRSQGWARAIIDIDVVRGEDINRVRELMLSAANQVLQRPEYAELAVEKPEVWGVEAINANSMVVRLVVKTVPMRQNRVARALREHIQDAFTAAGIATPEPSVSTSSGDPGSPPPAGADPL
ncbi:MAG: mechanosensitive ion channel family protein [Sporichthyaceae bacterium]